MSRPRTYAELRRQWLQRVMPGADLPDVGAEISPWDLRALVDELRQYQHDPEHALGATMDGARSLDLMAGGSEDDDDEVATLIEVARTARTVRGPGSQYIEAAALRALVDIADEEVLPFLVECFRFSRPHDGSAGHRRTIVLTGIATIALLTGNAEALAMLDEALAHSAVRVRLGACQAIADVAGMALVGLPASLAARLDHVARHDRSRDVRSGAAMALEAARASTGKEWTC